MHEDVCPFGIHHIRRAMSVMSALASLAHDIDHSHDNETTTCPLTLNRTTEFPVHYCFPQLVERLEVNYFWLSITPNIIHESLQPRQ